MSDREIVRPRWETIWLLFPVFSAFFFFLSPLILFLFLEHNLIYFKVFIMWISTSEYLQAPPLFLRILIRYTIPKSSPFPSLVKIYLSSSGSLRKNKYRELPDDDYNGNSHHQAEYLDYKESPAILPKTILGHSWSEEIQEITEDHQGREQSIDEVVAKMSPFAAGATPHEREWDSILHSEHQIEHVKLHQKENSHHAIILHNSGRCHKDNDHENEEHDHCKVSIIEILIYLRPSHLSHPRWWYDVLLLLFPLFLLVLFIINILSIFTTIYSSLIISFFIFFLFWHIPKVKVLPSTFMVNF